MLFLKTTQAQFAEGLYLVDIAARPPGRTYGVFMAIDADSPPEQLLASLEGMGFKRTVAAPYIHQDGKKVIDLHFHKTGTDIFDGWTLAERDANLQALDTLFSGIGVKINPRVMSLAEAF